MSAALVLALIGLGLIALGKASENSLSRYEFNNTTSGGTVTFASHRKYRSHERSKVTAWKVQRLGRTVLVLAGLVWLISAASGM